MGTGSRSARTGASREKKQKKTAQMQQQDQTGVPAAQVLTGGQAVGQSAQVQ